MTEPVNPATTYEAMPEAEPHVVVVYCSDPRFQTAFDQFVERELGLRKGQFIPLVVAGGAGVLARPEQLPKEFKFMRDRLELFCGGHSSIDRVVLINHEDCAYYKMLAKRLPGLLRPDVDGQSHRSRADLEPIAAIFHRLLAHLGVEIELYYARFADNNYTRIAFEHIPV